jgi:Transposase, Mutator family
MAAPVLAIGDGALGFRAALRDVFLATREQRCWFHKIANVLNALPKSAQPGTKAALAEIWNAEDREHAEAAARSFVAEYGTKWPKAVGKITDDLDVLEFYNYPAEHWVHLRTTNPIWVFGLLVRIALSERDPAGHGGWALTLNSIGAPPGCLRTRGVGPRHQARGGWWPGLKGAWALNPDLPARGLLVSRPAPAMRATGGWRA